MISFCSFHTRPTDIVRKRCGRVEEIAALVAFAASEEAGFTSGFCWDATGGRATY
jgi:hypothetical protein